MRGALLFVGFLTLSALGLGMGVYRLMEAQTRLNVGLHQVSSTEGFQKADLDRIQRDRRTAPVEVAVGIAEAAIAGQSAATPGVSPNPVMIGLGEGMTLGGLAAQAADTAATPSDDATVAAPETPQDPPGGADGASTTPPGSEQPQPPPTTQVEPSPGSGEADPGARLVAPEVGVDPATAPRDHYVAWYVVDGGQRLLFLTSVDYYRSPTFLPRMNLGSEEEPLPKHLLTNAVESHWDITVPLDAATTSHDKQGQHWSAVIDGERYESRVAYELTNLWEGEE